MGTYEWQSPADKEKAERKLDDAATFLRDASNAIAIRDSRIAALESTERELLEAVKVLAEYAGSADGLSGPFKCWDSRRLINAREALERNPIASAAVREAGR